MGLRSQVIVSMIDSFLVQKVRYELQIKFWCCLLYLLPAAQLLAYKQITKSIHHYHSSIVILLAHSERKEGSASLCLSLPRPFPVAVLFASTKGTIFSLSLSLCVTLSFLMTVPMTALSLCPSSPTPASCQWSAFPVPCNPRVSHLFHFCATWEMGVES